MNTHFDTTQDTHGDIKELHQHTDKVILIQKIARGYLDRKHMVYLRHLAQLHNARAATSIQKIYRGYITRLNLAVEAFKQMCEFHHWADIYHEADTFRATRGMTIDQLALDNVFKRDATEQSAHQPPAKRARINDSYEPHSPLLTHCPLATFGTDTFTVSKLE